MSLENCSVKTQPFVENMKELRTDFCSVIESHSSDNKSSSQSTECEYEASDWQRLKMSSSDDEDQVLLGGLVSEQAHCGSKVLQLIEDRDRSV